CHILECSDGLAKDVISTIGQAFDLRFQQYLQCPSNKMSSVHDRVLNVEELAWTEEEEETTEHPYYNNIPGKMPPPGGFIDTRLTTQNAAPDGGQVAHACGITVAVQRVLLSRCGSVLKMDWLAYCCNLLREPPNKAWYGQKIIYLTALATLLDITVTTICQLSQLGVNSVFISPLKGNCDA
ncbi:hypothetical protein GOODEAATRI_019057, partial [Goodea atripinnis]